jgi:hypothetical protein
MDKKTWFYFSFIVIVGIVIYYLLFRETNSQPISVSTKSDDDVTVSSEDGTSNPQQSPNEVASPTLTYNAPTNIMAADPESQSYLTHSQTAALLQSSVNSQLQNAVSTGLTE